VADVVAQSDDESQTPLQPLNGDPPPLLQPPDDDSLLVEDEASDHLPPPRPILYDRPPYLQQFLENRLSARQSLQELLTRDQQSTLARAETPHDGEDSTQALRRESDSLSPRRRFPLGRLLLGRR